MSEEFTIGEKSRLSDKRTRSRDKPIIKKTSNKNMATDASGEFNANIEIGNAKRPSEIEL